MQLRNKNLYDKSQKRDIMLIEEGALMSKPSPESGLDKKGVDAYDWDGRKVDTKYPDTINQFFFQVDKILDESYIITEKYWYVYNSKIYEWDRNDLKKIVQEHRDKWNIKLLKDGTTENRLYISSICRDPSLIKPVNVLECPPKTAQLIAQDLKKNIKYYSPISVGVATLAK